ncbi:hypothetical protein VFPFJ_02352 [Purpureocillium lilacinum]|uniref:Uncharacterized protein n=1 Tax=Purpureocillium lilacinum TaxID=33203 RepID=A0A179HUE4_PURLI|nr:hypothetical protein VFPFJ_02352 [Purpureocillium lilacinum]OAQ93191.1 hypothetical protein VFPFJ_02352 [Purpureocillium lilacinum]
MYEAGPTVVDLAVATFNNGKKTRRRRQKESHCSLPCSIDVDQPAPPSAVFTRILPKTNQIHTQNGPVLGKGYRRPSLWHQRQRRQAWSPSRALEVLVGQVFLFQEALSRGLGCE